MNVALDHIICGGLILVLIFTALAFGTVESWSIALFELLVLVLLALWGIKVAVEGQLTLLIPSVMWPLLALFVVGVLQSVVIGGADGQGRSLSLDVEVTRLTVVTLLCVIIACLLFANFLVREERVQKVGVFLVFYGLIFSVFGLVQHFSWNGKFFWFVEPTRQLSAPFGSFVNHSHFAGYVEMMMPFPLAMILFKSVNREARIFYGFAAIVMGVAAVISLSRGGMISMLAGLLFVLLSSLLVLQRRHSWSRHAPRLPLTILVSRMGAGFCVLLMIVGGIFWVGADPVINRVAITKLSGEIKPGEQTLYSSRGFIWQGTLKMIADYPLIGIGLGAYETVYPRYSGHDTASLRVAQAHNDYLQILADAGVVGGVLAGWFLWLLVRDFFAGLRHPDPKMAALALGAGGGIFAMLVHSVFDFNLQLPSNELMFLLLAAIVSVIGLAVRRQPGARKIARPIPRAKQEAIPLIARS
jgi:O-antigen ligase